MESAVTASGAGRRPRSSRADDLPGSRSAVVAAARIAGAMHAVVALVALVGQGGLEGVSLLVAVAVSMAGCAVSLPVARCAVTASSRRVRQFSVGLCVALLGTTITSLTLTRQLEQSAALMLVVVALSWVAVNRRDIVVLMGLAMLGWTCVVRFRGPSPADQVGHYAVQLVVACALSLALFAVRQQVLTRLGEAQERIATQRDELLALGTKATDDLVRLRGLINASPVGLALSDELGRLVEVNPAFCALTGRPESELLGQGAALFTHPEDMASTARSGELIAASPPGFVRLENRFMRPDGTSVWVSLTLSHVVGPVGQVWTLAHAEDITDQKLAAEHLRRSRDVIEAARLVAHAAALAQDLRGVILAQTQKVTDASSVHFIEEYDDDHLVLVASGGDQSLVGTLVDLDQVSVTRHVWESGETVFVDEGHDHPLVDLGLLAQSDARSLMWAPVVAEGEVAAIISIAWADRRSHVDDLQRSAVDTIAAEAGAALVSERVRASLVRWSTTDPLTGLLNRRGWDVEIETLDRAGGQSDGVTVIALFDLDHFKAYNDSHGHEAGDAALSSFGRSLSETQRAGDIVARWGGEEFIVALPGCPMPRVHAILERLRRCAPPGITSSVGYTVVAQGEGVRAAIGRADRALYRAKANGRDQIRSADDLVPTHPSPTRSALTLGRET